MDIKGLVCRCHVIGRDLLDIYCRFGDTTEAEFKGLGRCSGPVRGLICMLTQ